MKMTIPAHQLIKQMRRSLDRNVIQPVKLARLGYVMAAQVMAVEQSVVDTGAYRAAWLYLLDGLPAPLAAIRNADLDQIAGIGNAMIYASYLELGYPNPGQAHWIDRDHGQIVRSTENGFWSIRTDATTGHSLQMPGGNLFRILDRTDGMLRQQLYVHGAVA